LGSADHLHDGVWIPGAAERVLRMRRFGLG
jgi:hypothetical protein